MNVILPPRLDSDPAARRSAFPAWALGALVVALVAAHAVELWHLPVPQCTTRSLTGLPCPFCGSTRTLMAVARGDLAQAAALNPLTFGGAAILVLWAGLWGIERLSGRPVTRAVRERLRRVRWRWPILIALAINWVYLWRTLPE